MFHNQDNCIIYLRKQWEYNMKQTEGGIKALKKFTQWNADDDKGRFPPIWSKSGKKAFKLIHLKSPLVWILQRLIQSSQVLAKLQWDLMKIKKQNCYNWCLIPL